MFLLEVSPMHTVKVFDKVFEEHFGKYASDKVDGFTALNTSMINSGLFVYVSKGASLSKTCNDN